MPLNTASGRHRPHLPPPSLLLPFCRCVAAEIERIGLIESGDLDEDKAHHDPVPAITKVCMTAVCLALFIFYLSDCLSPSVVQACCSGLLPIPTPSFSNGAFIAESTRCVKSGPEWTGDVPSMHK